MADFIQKCELVLSQSSIDLNEPRESHFLIKLLIEIKWIVSEEEAVRFTSIIH
jgi:hypothetical protein